MVGGQEPRAFRVYSPEVALHRNQIRDLTRRETDHAAVHLDRLLHE